jgi:hypothetical protein
VVWEQTSSAMSDREWSSDEERSKAPARKHSCDRDSHHNQRQQQPEIPQPGAPLDASLRGEGALPLVPVQFSCRGGVLHESRIEAPCWPLRPCTAYQSLCEIPNLRIMAFSVLQCSPESSSGSVTTPPLSWST